MNEGNFDQPSEPRRDPKPKFLERMLERSVFWGVQGVGILIDLIGETAEESRKMAERLRSKLPPDQRT